MIRIMTLIQMILILKLNHPLAQLLKLCLLQGTRPCQLPHKPPPVCLFNPPMSRTVSNSLPTNLPSNDKAATPSPADSSPAWPWG